MPKSPDPVARQRAGRHDRQSSRGFTEIPIQELGHQPGRERHAALLAAGHEQARNLDAWRHNLSALSQVHNLFFLANGPSVEVYRPQYPSQKISWPPALVVQLSVSGPGLVGHMPNCDPHAVNHLVVAKLGEQEILLCACDDGDVLAYHTDSIIAVIDRHHLPVPEDCAAHFIKPFFHSNVGKSAWGLAVHTAARLIAVSSNSYYVTVFVFALQHSSRSSTSSNSSQDPSEPQEDDGNDNDDVSDEEWPDVRPGRAQYEDPAFRSKNFRVVLGSHGANIPSIAFCNVEDDPHGTWLVSTTISGATSLWCIPDGTTHRLLLPDNALNENYAYRHEYDMWRGGWGVFWVDERAFGRADNVVEAMGTCELVKRGAVAIADTTHSRTMVRRSSRWKIGDMPRTGATADEEEEDGFASLDDDPDDGEDLIAAEEDINAGSLFTSSSKSSDCPTSAQDIFRINCRNMVPERSTRETAREDVIGLRSWPMFGLKCVGQQDTAVPKTPLVLLNNRAVSILQSAALDRRSTTSPVVYLEDPLRQDAAEHIAQRLQHYDRLNIYLQIPELGVLLVASPKGRVAVLTLHQLAANPFYSGATEPLYTMRLDHLLPFSTQEERLERPPQQLVGLAASPLQGSASKETCTKWRVMLTYRDYTTLSYEIGRDSPSVFGTGEVVV